VQHHDASDATDEPNYPLAPLPVHERTWRHPSEVGRANWESTEPPVAIGRGLFITTTAIGFVLGVAVLLLLAPMGDTEVAAPARSAWPVATADAVANTVLVDHADPTRQTPDDSMPIAVAVASHELIITTAKALAHAAIGFADGVSIIGWSDEAAGTVVSVVGSLAFIRPAVLLDVQAFDEIRTAVPGQVLTVLTDEPTEIVYGRQPVGGIDEPGIREGTPVVDDDGALVALCTLTKRSGDVLVELVPVPHQAPVVDERTPTGSADPAD
jgi:hypothetical protein